jgi:hypothetical protein
MRHILWYSILLIAGTFPAYAQLRLEAELRPRVLVDNGYSVPKPADDPTHAYVSQRTRLNALFSGEKLETYISVQDVRIWGDDDNYKASGMLGNTRSVSLHQAWFLVKPAEWLSLKVGRQLLSYDDQRILSSRGWNDYQVTYDAVLAVIGSGANRVDLGVSWNAQSSKYAILPPEKFKTLDFLHYARDMGTLKWSAIALVTGNSVSATTEETWYRSTLGTNLDYSGDRAQARGSFYYQHHLNKTGGQLSAFCFSVNAGIAVIPDRLSGSAGIDYISGQDDVKAGDEYRETGHAFDLLYGRRHSWYGYMDYFSTMPSQGLEDYMLQAKYNFSGSVDLAADYHFFRTAAGIVDPLHPGEVMERYLGSELDLTLNWKLSKEASLQAGYSFFLDTRTLEALKGVRGMPLKFPQFAYLMVTVKPSFLFGQAPDAG